MEICIIKMAIVLSKSLNLNQSIKLTPSLKKSIDLLQLSRFELIKKIENEIIEMVEIGAGGGSIARVNKLDQIITGPDSAGSNPGPACYSNGGNNPTITDADLVIGKIDPNKFAEGKINLSKKFAKNAEIITEETKDVMRKALARIQSGEFTKEWMDECKNGQKNFLQTRAKLAEHPVEKVGANLRAMMPWIGKKKLVDSDKK